jgi:hypothetical protein
MPKPKTVSIGGVTDYIRVGAWKLPKRKSIKRKGD